MVLGRWQLRHVSCEPCLGIKPSTPVTLAPSEHNGRCTVCPESDHTGNREVKQKSWFTSIQYHPINFTTKQLIMQTEVVQHVTVRVPSS